MSDVVFEDCRKAILGVRAAGLLFLGWGLMAPAMLIGLVVRVYLSPDRISPTIVHGFTRIDSILEALTSKHVLLSLFERGSFCVVSLVVGICLLRADARHFSWAERLVR